MPDTQIVDEVVSTRPASVGRRVISETVDKNGSVTVAKNEGTLEESVREGGLGGRVFSEAAQKALDRLEQAPAHDEGDPDDDAPAAPEVPAGQEGDPDDEDASAEETPEGEAAKPAEGETTTDETPAVDEELKASHARLEERNRTLMAELEEARATPKQERTKREQSLVDAENAYVDEGSVPALRKFLGVVLGAAPDSKDVDAELSGLLADLTARELNVPLDHSQQALREAARSRLALARDKRERAESEKKSAPANSGEAEAIANTSRFIDNQLVTKDQSGASLADEFPLLMKLAEDFDGYKASEVIARAVKQELTIGTLDPTLQPAAMIRHVGRKIESYYDGLVKKINQASQPKTSTTKGDPKTTPATAKPVSQEQRQSQGARTITQAAASKAPGTNPKTQQQAKPTTEKTRKDFKTDAAWRAHLLKKHLG